MTYPARLDNNGGQYKNIAIWKTLIFYKVMMAERISFKTETVNKLLQEHFTDKKTKLAGDAMKLMAEFIRVFVAEGAARAGHQAKTESAVTVEIEHLEKILPQLLLDF